jgi:hypothetical protein
VTDQSSKDFVKPQNRIAVFDNDGTLWSGQPMYFAFVFAWKRSSAPRPTPGMASPLGQHTPLVN